MADEPISGMGVLGSLAGTEVVPLIIGTSTGDNKSCTTQQIADLAGAGGPTYDSIAEAMVDHYYVMNEATGTVIADTGITGAAPGTYNSSGVLLQQVALRGDSKGCPIFDGATGYATVPANTTIGGTTFGLMCEFNPKWDPAASLVCIWDSRGTDTGLLLFISGGALTAEFGDGSTMVSITAGNFSAGVQPPLGPMSFMFTHDGTVGKFIVNGFLIGEQTHGYTPGAGLIYVASTVIAAPSFLVPGSLGKVICHPAPLTPAQYSSLNNAQRIG